MPISVLTKSDFTPMTLATAAKRFGTKAALTSDAFERLSAEAKQRAFRIATVHKANLIQRARDVVHKAIRDGTSFQDVRRQLLALFDTEGVPRVSAARLRTIFITNTQQAYNDARRETLDEPEIAAAFPYRQYLTVGNGVPGVRGVRPTHAALHGLVFRWDEPFWDSHTPPWDFNCRCTIRPLTAGQVRRMGVKVRNAGYIRKRIRVRGQKRRGIAANPDFVRGKLNLGRIDRELRKALEEMIT